MSAFDEQRDTIIGYAGETIYIGSMNAVMAASRVWNQVWWKVVQVGSLSGSRCRIVGRRRASVFPLRPATAINKKRARPASRAAAAKPPTTAPAITPASELFLDAAAELVGVCMIVGVGADVDVKLDVLVGMGVELGASWSAFAADKSNLFLSITVNGI